MGNEVRANSFLLLDENGKVRSRLALRDDGLALVFADEKGRTRASLSVDKDTTSLGLRDANGKLRAGQLPASAWHRTHHIGNLTSLLQPVSGVSFLVFSGDLAPILSRGRTKPFSLLA